MFKIIRFNDGLERLHHLSTFLEGVRGYFNMEGNFSETSFFYWEDQFDLYVNGFRDGKMHDYTLIALSSLFNHDFLVAHNCV